MKPIANSKEKNQLPEYNTPCRVKARIMPIEDCRGFFVKDKNLVTRKSLALGKYIGYVPGGGGDLWWIQHEDGTVAAYVCDEITDR